MLGYRDIQFAVTTGELQVYIASLEWHHEYGMSSFGIAQGLDGEV